MEFQLFEKNGTTELFFFLLTKSKFHENFRITENESPRAKRNISDVLEKIMTKVESFVFGGEDFVEIVDNK